MTTKSLIRFAIGIVIALILLSILVPLAGIPRAQIFPPSYAYQSASGATRGVVTKKHSSPTGNPFKVGEGEKWYLVEYEFTAPAGPSFPMPGSPPTTPGKVAKFGGTVRVPQAAFDKFQEGQVVPIRYEKTYPWISGINLPYGGRSGASGSGIISGWIIWAVVTVVLGYLLAGALERLILRESY